MQISNRQKMTRRKQLAASHLGAALTLAGNQAETQRAGVREELPGSTEAVL